MGLSSPWALMLSHSRVGVEAVKWSKLDLIEPVEAARFAGVGFSLFPAFVGPAWDGFRVLEGLDEFPSSARS